MFGIKLRSLPNKYTIERYLMAFTLPIIALFFYKVLEICMADGDKFPLALPDIVVFIFPLLFFGVYYNIEIDYKKVDKYDVKKIVMLIQVKHLQELREELALKPEVIKCKYKNKSLIYWAKHYNNPQAHTIIAKFMNLKAR